ncbi:MAG: SdiA-regulated domain-containing protein [Deltaproteobacteria bacterium]|nr:SdiA-regulated domain-containing protein [Deltaproteobacteria bacterium]
MKKAGSFGQAVVVSQRPLGVQEASGVAHLGGDRFLVVDDESGIFRCPIDGEATQLAAGQGLRDLEGVCVTPDGSHAYVLSERDGSLWRFALADGELGDGKRVGRLPRLSKKKNQGWEGITIAPAGLWSDQDELVAVHQSKPRCVAVLDPVSLEPRVTAGLPKAARKRLGDLNDVTVDPHHGHVLVLSGKAGMIGELAFEGEQLRLLRC